MRMAFVLMALLCPPVGAESAEPLVIRTLDGRVYESVSSIRVAPNQIRFIHRDGAAAVRLDALPADLQQRFSYDPEKSAAADRADAARRKAEAASAQADARAQYKKAEAIRQLRSENYGGATYHSSSKDIKDARDASAMRTLTKAGVAKDEALRIIEWLKEDGKNQKLHVHPEFRRPLGMRRSGSGHVPR